MLLAACGGGGGGESSAPVVTAPVPQLSLLGPDYGDALLATECGTVAGSARQARYPVQGSFSRDFGGILRGPLAMRADGAGGLIVAQDQNLVGSQVDGPGMYRVDAAGAKVLLNISYTRAFDVAPDGAIWYAQSSAQANAAFGTRNLPGTADTVLAIQQGYAGAPLDGPLGV